MPNIGAPELIILLIVLLLVFGPKRLPEMGRSVGRGIREFKDSVSGNEKPEEQKAEHPPVTAAAPVPVESPPPAPVPVTSPPPASEHAESTPAESDTERVAR